MAIVQRYKEMHKRKIKWNDRNTIIYNHATTKYDDDNGDGDDNDDMVMMIIDRYK